MQNLRKLLFMLFGCMQLAAVAQTRLVNPVLWADVPDPDIIRVGDTYYLMSTTMHLMPGAPVMQSKDLVNWETIGYLFDKLTDSPKYDLKQGTAYGRGQWATSLKYHKGVFYALFAPNDNPGGDSYLYTTTDPKQEWTLKTRLPHFHDCSLFFDDDGRIYVFSGTGNINELKSDFSGIREDGRNGVLFERDSTETGLLEGSRVVKRNGKYYLIMVSWPANKPRRQVCYRASNLDGPWEKRVILESTYGGFSYVGQGTIVDDVKDNWYGLIFQDRGGVGRVLTLNPCTWQDGWPMLGDSEGHVPHTMDIPLPETPAAGIVLADDFSDSQLGLQWEWNHNPVDDAWSLTERKGWLRLKTSETAQNLFAARNTISQRLEGPVSTATILVDLSHMKSGDRTGLSAFNGDAGMLEVTPLSKGYQLSMATESVRLSDQPHGITGLNRTEVETVTFNKKKIWLRMQADFRPGQDLATFSYSLDGKEWTSLGKPFKMIFDYTRLFMGTRVAIYNYATTQSGGWVDVDRFDYECQPKE